MNDLYPSFPFSYYPYCANQIYKKALDLHMYIILEIKAHIFVTVGNFLTYTWELRILLSTRRPP